MRINNYSQQLNSTKFQRSQNGINKGKQYNNIAFKANLPKVVMDKTTDVLAYGFGKLAALKPMQSLVNWLKNKNYQEHLAAFIGCTLSGFYMLDTARSKTIEKDQKMPLIMNQGVVCALSTAGGYTVNHYLNKKLNGLTETFHISQIPDKALQEEFIKCKEDYSYINTFKEKAQSNPEWKAIFKDVDTKFEFNNEVKNYIKEELKRNPSDSEAKEFLEKIKSVKPTANKDKADIIKELFMQSKEKSESLKIAHNRIMMNNAISNLAKTLKAQGKPYLTNMMNGFKTAKALMVFALLYRFVGPVFATPIANKFSEKIENKKKLNKAA